jgi:hypothetical protein
MIEQPLDVAIRVATAARPSMRCKVDMGEIPRWAAPSGRRRTTATHAPPRSPLVSVVTRTPIEETLRSASWASR